MALPDLRAALQQTLQGEVLRNERTIAYVRAIALACVSLIGAAGFVWSERLPFPIPPSYAALVGAYSMLAALSFGLVLWMRRTPYRAWMRVGLPLLDAAIFVGTAYANRRLWGPRYVEVGCATNLAIAAVVLALEGALRLTAWDAVLSTVLAGAGFVYVVALASPAISLPSVAIGLGVLVGAGSLAVRLARTVRRAAAGELARVALGRFLPDQVVGDAYRDPEALLAAPRSAVATVVVSDLRGFTRFSESRTPAEVFATLSDVQGRLASAVRAHGGTVDKFMGDGMLAVFGAMQPAPDHAADALRAARAMLDAMADFNAHSGNEPLRLGIGLHTGALVAGCLGSGERLEFTVIGDTVNVASRLESLTKENGVPVLASEATAQLAGLVGELVEFGEVQIRGRREPMRIFGFRPAAQAATA